MAHETKALEFAHDGKGPAFRDGQAIPAHVAMTLPMVRSRLRHGIGSLSVGLLVAAGLCLVHDVSPAGAVPAEEKAATQSKATAKERAYHGSLPQPVADMRDQILSAVQAGNIDELKGAIEWNEIKPDFGEGPGGDAIAYLKKSSADGEGREVLAILANLLALPPARLAIGSDPENAMVYVWPYLAELPPDGLTGSEQVDLLRLVPADKAKAMRDARKWSWWRIAIGADGTWHTFRKYDR
jgi:hypothetical protein